MRLTPDEFIRRFLLHVLPDGFHRIRHYGFLANGHRAEKIARCRKTIAAWAAATEPEPAPAIVKARIIDIMICRDCGGLMRRIGDIAPMRPRAYRCDTS